MKSPVIRIALVAGVLVLMIFVVVILGMRSYRKLSRISGVQDANQQMISPKKIGGSSDFVHVWSGQIPGGSIVIKSDGTVDASGLGARITWKQTGSRTIGIYSSKDPTIPAELSEDGKGLTLNTPEGKVILTRQ